MTRDSLRDAVARFRGLREDVERLKSSLRSAGELRLLRFVDEEIGIDDAVSVSTETGGTFVADSSVADGTDTAG